ncbi:hypothetical protein MycrhN_0548 [Mycolicibacterium rhodesiae NBB3]|uniref:Uncharacterized protein n=1 Tax=Mycolicibacterium rhodesiae (strain NBB3) TaxID=710685 RepID=G8RM88_MYCRN|nr:hypothetical protein MycrhN_0548 [Mycolicibacterium rhodesiae NBB3]
MVQGGVVRLTSLIALAIVVLPFAATVLVLFD